ncbi:hypothetical protein [Actinoplanes auranticolor]|uniref:Uncharacterized protein n=1 Tax=Actinoplanes auranticolor TaxID=47988 RepID=A0A919VP75_9ACTN|nr:hypothetical protein [Actinoplanes auranticolor]GIM71021.1 hypothetical protein Aau02nite_43780 [Actinoplanes auranticolor]
MTDQLERELRLLFAEDADRAPAALSPAALAALTALAPPPSPTTPPTFTASPSPSLTAPLTFTAPPAPAEPPALAALPAEGRRVRRWRRSRIAWGAGSLVAASMAAVVGAGALTSSPPDDRTTAPPAAHPSADRRTGALPGAPGGSCALAYSPREVARRAFAFDGTVTAIGTGHIDRPDSVRNQAGVTFTVHEWFAGGSGATVAVDMPPPDGYSVSMGYGPPAYGIGTRLLVSGEYDRDGSTVADAKVWTCDFTRYYDESTADSWRAATR